jgi:hypothetical protein
MNPLSCAEIEEQIDLYALGECDPDAGAAVAAHLANCRSCARAYQEARRMIGLLDVHLRQEKGLARLKGRIAAEDRRTLRFRPPAVRRMFALAALLLVTFGLAWLAVPVPRGVPLSGGDMLVAQLTPHEAGMPVRNMEIAPAVMRAGPEHADTSIRIAMTAQIAPAELRKELEQGKHTGSLPLPPAIHRDLRLENKGPRDLVLRLEEGRFLLRIDLKGPGVVYVSVPRGGQEPFTPPGKVRLPPGATLILPVVRLSEVVAGKVRYVYWTEPGRYKLKVRLVVGVDGAAAPLTVTTPPIAVQVAP